ncbi:MAG TPA: response regulator [Candidatus Dormibacteraeota bacterium]|nr:response regulator [Candidatus Dormibacteraeota bacterium]
MPEEPSKRHQFLFVDDDQVFLLTLTSLLKQISNANWGFRTASNHAQALEHLKAQPVDVVVLDIEMPVMDGVEFLRLLGRSHPNLRVVMLSARLDETARKNTMDLGAALYLEKPTTPEGFKAVFAALDLLVTSPTKSGAGFRGVMQVGLQDVLQMECLSRKSSILAVSTGSRRGQIYVCDGQIVHAQSGQLQGEMALYGLLGLSGGEFKLEPYVEPPSRSISGQYEFLLMEAARLCDEQNGSGNPLGNGHGSANALRAALSETSTPTEARGICIEEALLCSSVGEVLYQWKCESIETRLELFKNLERGAMFATKGTPSGRFHRISTDSGNSRVLVLIQPTFKLLIRSAIPAASTVTN